MTEEVHRVREATLRALEPEIRKLTRNQQDDAKKIQTEADSEVSLLKVELDAEKRKSLQSANIKVRQILLLTKVENKHHLCNFIPMQTKTTKII